MNFTAVDGNVYLKAAGNRSGGTLGLGLVDASVVAVAERLRITRIVTRDVRHFAAVELRGGKRFELVVQPTRPDPGDPRR